MATRLQFRQQSGFINVMGDGVSAGGNQEHLQEGGIGGRTSALRAGKIWRKAYRVSEGNPSVGAQGFPDETLSYSQVGLQRLTVAGCVG